MPARISLISSAGVKRSMMATASAQVASATRKWAATVGTAPSMRPKASNSSIVSLPLRPGDAYIAPRRAKIVE